MDVKLLKGSGCLHIVLRQLDAIGSFHLNNLSNTLFLPPFSVSDRSDWVDVFDLHPITPSTTVRVCTLNLTQV